MLLVAVVLLVMARASLTFTVGYHSGMTTTVLQRVERQHNGQPVRFTAGVIDLIKNANYMTDVSEVFNPVAHCDDDRITECATRVCTKRQEVVDVLWKQAQACTSGGCVDELAPRALGKLLHTLQDFYSHSTAVETCGVEQTATLRSRLHFQSPFGTSPWLTASCQQIDPARLGLRDRCSVDNPFRRNGICVASSRITTGFYRHNGAPGTCRHGGFLDHAWLQSSTANGINKDTPERHLGPLASDFAMEATEYFVQDLLSTLQSLPETRQRADGTVITGSDLMCGFMLGDMRECCLGQPIGFVIDTTTSMTEDLAEVLQVARQMVGNPAVGKIYLVTFGETFVSAVTSFCSAEEFSLFLNTVRIAFEQNEDCPEPSITALLTLVREMSAGAIFLLTDAAPKDASLTATTTATAVRKGIVVTVVTRPDSCSSSKTHIQQNQFPSAFVRLTQATAGFLINLGDRSQIVQSIVEVLPHLIERAQTDSQIIFFSQGGHSLTSFEFTVDQLMQPVTATVSSSDLIGETLLLDIQGNNYTGIYLSDNLVQFRELPPNSYTLQVTSVGQYTVQVEGQTPLALTAATPQIFTSDRYEGGYVDALANPVPLANSVFGFIVTANNDETVIMLNDTSISVLVLSAATGETLDTAPPGLEGYPPQYHPAPESTNSSLDFLYFIASLQVPPQPYYMAVAITHPDFGTVQRAILPIRVVTFLGVNLTSASVTFSTAEQPVAQTVLELRNTGVEEDIVVVFSELTPLSSLPSPADCRIANSNLTVVSPQETVLLDVICDLNSNATNVGTMTVTMSGTLTHEETAFLFEFEVTVVNCAGTPPCSGNGECLFQNDEVACQCYYGWTGDLCSTLITCTNDCSGHGVCDASDPDDPICLCQDTWELPDCSTQPTLTIQLSPVETSLFLTTEHLRDSVVSAFTASFPVVFEIVNASTNTDTNNIPFLLRTVNNQTAELVLTTSVSNLTSSIFVLTVQATTDGSLGLQQQVQLDLTVTIVNPTNPSPSADVIDCKSVDLPTRPVGVGSWTCVDCRDGDDCTQQCNEGDYTGHVTVLCGKSGWTEIDGQCTVILAAPSPSAQPNTATNGGSINTSPRPSTGAATTSPTTPPIVVAASPDSDENSSAVVGGVIGGAVGLLVIVAVAALIGVCLYRQSDHHSPDGPTYSSPYGTPY